MRTQNTAQNTELTELTELSSWKTEHSTSINSSELFILELTAFESDHASLLLLQ
jgi:hypothetical protein